MRRTISNGLPGVNVTHLEDFGFETNHLSHRVGLAGERIDAVKRGPRAHDLEVIIAAEIDPRGRCERGRSPRQPRERRAENRQLLGIFRMFGFIGAGEVAHDRCQLESLETIGVLGEFHPRAARQSQPRHAGVEMDDRG